MKPLPEPYSSIKILPFDEHGWFFNKESLHDCLKRTNAKIVIEVGSWLGLSTRFIAGHLPEGGKVYAIDTWLGSKENQSDPRLPFLFRQFLSNIIHAKLTEKIVPIRMASLEAESALNLLADVIYIDASHEEEDVYQDIMRWSEHLRPQGIICGDDWRMAAVRSGVLRAAFTLGCQVRPECNFWWFEPL